MTLVADRADAEISDAAQPDGSTRRLTPERMIDAAVAFVCVGVATAWTFNPFRTPFSGRTFSNFFEAQATGFLEGRLALEKGELGIEAFVRDGADFMYFGPLLALFRVPTSALEVLQGQLTVISLLVGTLLFHVQAVKTFDIVLDLVHPSAVGSSRVRWWRLVWRASVTIGTVILTLLAIPWVYHEAHLWSAAVFLTVLNQMLRFEQMTRRQIIVFGIVLVAVVLNRPTTAYGAMIGVALLLVIVSIRRSASWANIAHLGTWLGVALLSAVAVNMAKFRKPFGIPMEAQVFSTVDEHRAEMLRVNDGKYFRLEFIPTNVWAYFRPNGVDVSSTFPFVSTPRAVPRVFGDYFYDATYRTASVTATNPLLVVGSFLGIFALVKLARTDAIWRLAAPVAAGVLAAGGVAGWGYIATRYLTDFLPGMLVLSAIGIAWALRHTDARRDESDATAEPSPWSRIGRGIVVALVGWSILANTSISLAYNFSAGDSATEVERLLGAEDAVGSLIGTQPSERTIRVDSLRYDRDDPVAPGTLAIIGECEALYRSNGEPVDTWIEVEYGESDWRTEFTMTPVDVIEGDEIELARIDETAARDGYFFILNHRVDRIFADEGIIEYSLIMIDNFGLITIDELEMPLDESTDFEITFERYRRNFFVERNGQNILYGHFDMDPLYDSADPLSEFVRPGQVAGMRIDGPTAPIDTPWCDRLDSAALDLTASASTAASPTGR